MHRHELNIAKRVTNDVAPAVHFARVIIEGEKDALAMARFSTIVEALGEDEYEFEVTKWHEHGERIYPTSNGWGAE